MVNFEAYFFGTYFFGCGGWLVASLVGGGGGVACSGLFGCPAVPIVYYIRII